MSEISKVINQSGTNVLKHPMYFVIFTSRESPVVVYPGHAFVGWGVEDDDKRVSVEDAWGFYPKEGSKGVFGNVPGIIRDEFYKKRSTSILEFTARLTVIVPKSNFDRSRAVLANWRREEFSNYHLVSRNCITFATEVAQSLGLAIPDRGEFPDAPLGFMKKLIQLNGSVSAYG